MFEVLSSLCFIVGAFAVLLGAFSLLRMPDIYMRLSSATKAVSFGLAFCLTGMALHFGRVYVTIGAISTMFFVFLTAPIAAHMISRAAYQAGVPLWGQTEIDELATAEKAASSEAEPKS